MTAINPGRQPWSRSPQSRIRTGAGRRRGSKHGHPSPSPRHMHTQGSRKVASSGEMGWCDASSAHGRGGDRTVGARGCMPCARGIGRRAAGASEPGSRWARLTFGRASRHGIWQVLPIPNGRGRRCPRRRLRLRRVDPTADAPVPAFGRFSVLTLPPRHCARRLAASRARRRPPPRCR